MGIYVPSLLLIHVAKWHHPSAFLHIAYIICATELKPIESVQSFEIGIHLHVCVSSSQGQHLVIAKCWRL